jgi:hypothetical protein
MITISRKRRRCRENNKDNLKKKPVNKNAQILRKKHALPLLTHHKDVWHKSELDP